MGRRPSPVGTLCRATYPGVVKSVGWSAWGAAYGLHVVIASKNKKGVRVDHGYCHLSSENVTVGQRVAAGDVIGRTGETGRTFGAHLHYEERKAPFLYDNTDRDPHFDEMIRSRIRSLTGRKRRNHPNAGH
jgi:murein DD-endopeptidase MepM/ murein hydrolase activator NlpD